MTAAEISDDPSPRRPSLGTLFLEFLKLSDTVGEVGGRCDGRGIG